MDRRIAVANGVVRVASGDVQVEIEVVQVGTVKTLVEKANTRFETKRRDKREVGSDIAVANESEKMVTYNSFLVNDKIFILRL